MCIHSRPLPERAKRVTWIAAKGPGPTLARGSPSWGLPGQNMLCVISRDSVLCCTFLS